MNQEEDIILDEEPFALTPLMQSVLVWLGIFITFYPIGSLVGADFNMGNWNTVGRGFLILIWVFVASVAAFSWFAYKLSQEEKS